MKLYEITIRPSGAFGTPLLGDTLFGCFCWQAAHKPDLLNDGLDYWIKRYAEKPFAVFSSAWPCFSKDGPHRYALKRPDLPLGFFLEKSKPGRRERYDRIKEIKKKKWILTGDALELDLEHLHLAGEKELMALAAGQARPEVHRLAVKAGADRFHTTETRTHNTINRLTGTTGTGRFAPFEHKVQRFFPETDLAVFVLIDSEATDIARIVEGLERIGKFGFGRDASTGLGRFKVTGDREKKPPLVDGANALFALGPSVPETDLYQRIYFNPFVRFGKHGDRLALGNPFKNPVLMADQGAVFVLKNPADMKKPYIGRAVTGISAVQPQATAQGYAIGLPLKIEADREE